MQRAKALESLNLQLNFSNPHIMNNEQELKELVRQKYSEIANQDRDQNLASCCGASACCRDEVYNIMADDYTQLEGYNPDADLGLGCGIPTAFAKIKEGDTVLDLGSGAGNDAFVARKATGASGKVIGVDFSEAMLQKARANAEKLQLHNVEFRQGDIEKLPVTANSVDVVLSNCVLNLVPNKEAVFSEVHRVLKSGGHFSISDIVLVGDLPPKIRQTAEMYAGCVSGAIQKETYLDLITKAGFRNVAILKEKEIVVPQDILQQYLSAEEAQAFLASSVGIYSITVYAEKSCCTPGSGCC